MSVFGDAPDVIRLTGLAARGRHGVFEHERREGQTFVTDVALRLDAGPAAATDDLTLTVDYAEVAETVVRHVTGDPHDLIETLAARIAEAVLAEQPRAAAVKVTVHKPQAPIPHDFADVSVTVARARAGA
ncbi:dihydroneopterin aldolase [Micrococcus sp.]|uniref:dihydroneopterin aldolase n=1 Tax=Micrococcus sp. TaxID=1271 RepID=UPI002A915F71|nr:dihydroneopterin aldolase [Micrococcus sp.]MDY6054654.1 dihydroneopterin aldolase [Micrococcus sp.]